MSVLEQPADQQLDTGSDIVHLTCCREPYPTRAFCGWDVTHAVLAPHPDPECIVCADIAHSIPAGTCVHGGPCTDPKEPPA